MKYESNEASDSKEDIKLIVEFQEYMTNLHLNDEAKLTISSCPRRTIRQRPGSEFK